MAIEGNSLSLDQVSDILNGQKIIAPKKDIMEIKNAISVYEKFDVFDVYADPKNQDQKIRFQKSFINIAQGTALREFCMITKNAISSCYSNL